ncbi:MAG: hypothetical protein OES09_15705, partial [Gammaproteobacteria bacterium]|nr:hypothetical protein [Gammaproteobacteria bacterium]
PRSIGDSYQLLNPRRDTPGRGETTEGAPGHADTGPAQAGYGSLIGRKSTPCSEVAEFRGGAEQG